ncbi:MAG: tryptophan--tRNA ligase [Patescibacteria group bacterium]
MNRIFSGIKPTGLLHIGNYFGAIKQWVDLAKESSQSVFCIVDLHAITVPEEPSELAHNTLSIAAWYLAAGIDPDKSIVFVQSTRPEHSELAWILNCQTKMGELSRMTQFKDKMSGGSAEAAGVGLFDYPVLMAADILLYNTDKVPVGQDQKQHVELTRDLAIRFNNKFGETFVIPEPVITKTGARIMGLDNPLKKMSKTAVTPLNYIALTDDEDSIREKLKKAVTDSGAEIKAVPGKPALTNLLNIFSEVSGKTVVEIEEQFEHSGYGEFKSSLAEAIIEYLKPVRKRYDDLISDHEELKKILKRGSDKAAPIAEKTLKQVKEKIGLGI